MKIAAIVVVYHAEKRILFQNIEAFASSVDTIIIWRNSPDDLAYLEKWRSKMVFMGDGTNRYMAKPLNEAIDYCISKGYDYLLTMDQDSCWEDFNRFIELVNALPKDGLVAIYAPNVNNYLKDSSIEYKDIEWVRK